MACIFCLLIDFSFCETTVLIFFMVGFVILCIIIVITETKSFTKQCNFKSKNYCSIEMHHHFMWLVTLLVRALTGFVVLH